MKTSGCNEARNNEESGDEWTAVPLSSLLAVHFKQHALSLPPTRDAQ